MHCPAIKTRLPAWDAEAAIDSLLRELVLTALLLSLPDALAPQTVEPREEGGLWWPCRPAPG